MRCWPGCQGLISPDEAAVGLLRVALDSTLTGRTGLYYERGQLAELSVGGDTVSGVAEARGSVLREHTRWSALLTSPTRWSSPRRHRQQMVRLRFSRVWCS